MSVRKLIDAAKRISSAEHRSQALVAAIAESTGLSTAGVELALSKHLEIDPTDDELRRLEEGAGKKVEQVVVILSSNVFVGALRAIAVACAAASSGGRVIVRPSRRDPAFARALVEATNDPAIMIDDKIDIESIETGEVHVYGRDETIADIRSRARPGVVVRGHGSGLGVAWISSRNATALDEAARLLADDVIAFDQRGCLSPRIVLVEGEAERADAFAEALHAELEKLDVIVPRGQLPKEEKAASDRYIATMTYACRVLVGAHHAIGIAPPGAPLVLAPTYRHVHVAACLSHADARALLEPMSRAIVAFGSDDIEAARALAPSWARISALGVMQRPRLDGPVDLRDTDHA